MKTNLLMIGDHSGKLIPSLISAAVLQGAGKLSVLDIFHLRTTEAPPSYESFAEDLASCRRALGPEAAAAYPLHFQVSCQSEFISLPEYQELWKNEQNQSLLSALRGTGVPFSLGTDREAAFWVCASVLKNVSEKLPLFSGWIDEINRSAESDSLALTLLFDPTNALEAGIAMAFIRGLRHMVSGKELFLTLIAADQTNASHPEERNHSVLSFLRQLKEYHLFRDGKTDGDGADALWLLSLPSSFAGAEEMDSAWLAFPIVQILLQCASGDPSLHRGVCLYSLSDDVAWNPLNRNSLPLRAFLRTAVWFVSTVSPACRALSDSNAEKRGALSIQRGALARFLGKKQKDQPQLLLDFPCFQRLLSELLQQLIRQLHSLPSSLIPSEEAETQWRDAVNACGRAVTTASEYDVLKAEADESGLSRVMPVHRSSLEDTDEEKMLRRLDDLAEKLDSQIAGRNEFFRILGGYRSFQVIRDCREKCAIAAAVSLQRLERLKSVSDSEHIAILAEERRLKKLQAAIRRCEKDLKEFCEKGLDRSLPSGNGFARPSPEAVFLGADLRSQLQERLSGNLSAEKNLRDHFSELIPKCPFPDEKTMTRKILKAYESAELTGTMDLFSIAWRTIREEETPPDPESFSSLLPEVYLLPDLHPEAKVSELSELIAMFPIQAEAEEDHNISGLFAYLLLLQYRQFVSDRLALSFATLEGSRSELIAAWLDIHSVPEASVVSVRQKDISLPFGIILPHKGLIPAKFGKEHGSFIPPHFPWYNRDSMKFENPEGLLFGPDRQILQQAFGLLKGETEADFPGMPERPVPEAEDGDPRPISGEAALSSDFSIFMQSVYGLWEYKQFRSVLSRHVLHYEAMSTGKDPLLSLLAGRTLSLSIPADAGDIAYYYWKEIPFVREDPRALFTGIQTPEFHLIRKTLSAECSLLAENSDNYRDKLVQHLQKALDHSADIFPAALSVVRNLLDEMSKPLSGSSVTLSWPWDPHSPSIQVIFSECLGEPLALSAVHPFSDLMISFPARGSDVIGDALFKQICKVEKLPAADRSESQEQSDVPERSEAEEPPKDPQTFQEAEDAVLPPIDAAFAAAICLFPEGRTLIQRRFLSFRRTEENGIQAVMNLEGAFSLQLIRLYPAEEILKVYSDEIPTVAVWPYVPFQPEQWRSYDLYLHRSALIRISVLSEDGTEKEAPETDDLRSVISMTSFPLCLLFHIGSKSAGALPNLLPRPILQEGGEVSVCMDFGASATSVLLYGNHNASPLNNSSAVRTLLMNPVRFQRLLQDEFISAPSSSLFSSIIHTFGETHDPDTVSFQEGNIVMNASLADRLLFSSAYADGSLAWNEPRALPLKLLIYQSMMTSALDARLGGASGLSWIIALPDGIPPARRMELVSLFRSIAKQVSEASGFTNPPEAPQLSFVSDTSAATAFFRSVRPDLTQGGLMILDLGASSIDLSIALRGRSAAEFGIHLPTGHHSFLLPILLKNPDLLFNSFSWIQDPQFQEALSGFHALLDQAKNNSASLTKVMFAADAFLAENSELLSFAISQLLLSSEPDFLSAVLLFHWSFLLMMTGMLYYSISVDPMRNDTLSPDMPVFLSGRGFTLLHRLPNPISQGLWAILNMFRCPNGAVLRLETSPQPKFEIASGLSFATQQTTDDPPPVSPAPALLPIRPETLLPEFLLRFRNEFPAAANRLFPAFFTMDYYHPFSDYGESVLSSSILPFSSEFLSENPYLRLSSWPSVLLDTIYDSRRE